MDRGFRAGNHFVSFGNPKFGSLYFGNPIVVGFRLLLLFYWAASSGVFTPPASIILFLFGNCFLWWLRGCSVWSGFSAVPNVHIVFLLVHILDMSF